MSTEIIHTKLQEKFPEAKIEVHSPRNDDHHLSVKVICSSFAGKTLLERQRSILNTFKEEFNQFLHALQVNAWTPEEYKERTDGSGN